MKILDFGFPFQILRSVVINGFMNRFTVAQNAVDWVRRKGLMSIQDGNFGASSLKVENETRAIIHQEPTSTVLFSDIFDAAVKQSQPDEIIIKADIEHFECRAFLGSPQGKTYCISITFWGRS